MAADKPKTLVAFLVSSGYRKPHATLHKYLETRETEMLDTVSGKPIREDAEAYEHIFICQETGVERRYGMTNRTVPRWAKDGN